MTKARFIGKREPAEIRLSNIECCLKCRFFEFHPDTDLAFVDTQTQHHVALMLAGKGCVDDLPIHDFNILLDEVLSGWDENLGTRQCQRFPPVQNHPSFFAGNPSTEDMTDEQCDSLAWDQPFVSPIDWCGEYKPYD